MKAALIPPIPHLDVFGTGELHLLLAHLCKKRAYMHHYQAQRQKGAYLILDNSAHEYKEGVDAGLLAAHAISLNVQEVVVPDVLDNGPSTVERAIVSLEAWFEGTRDGMQRLNPTLMYVAQGKDAQEYHTCMDELIQLHSFVARKKDLRRDFVLGISKDYQDLPGGLDAVLDRVKIYRDRLWHDKEIRMHVHILGWSRKLWVLPELALKYPWVRSTDSCKPFQFARREVYLDPKEEIIPKYPGRHPERYFEMKFTAEQLKAAHHNAQVFIDAARGIIR